ncbi:ATP-binding cassette domain-containing protein [bacterium]|nr:ATP-binding cassette domain-containing protein [bacterium]
MNKQPIILLENVSKSFGSTQVLKEINLKVSEGESAVVMGGSGSGKSVLIKHLVGLLRPDSGTVTVLGKRVDQISGDELDRLRLSIGYLFQSGALFDSMTVEENLLFFLERHKNLSTDQAQEKIEETLEWVGLPEKRHQFPAELSGGQKKRIALARAIILEPKIVLYDEPTTGLDPVSVRMVADLIVRLREERGITSVAITHDLLCAEIISDSVHFLQDGAFVTSGSLEEISQYNDPAIATFFGTELSKLS